MSPIYASIPIHPGVFPHGLHFRAARLTPQPGDPCFIGPEGRQTGIYVDKFDGQHRIRDADGALHETDPQGLFLDLHLLSGRITCAAWLGVPADVLTGAERDQRMLTALAHVLYLRKCNGVFPAHREITSSTGDRRTDATAMRAGAILNDGDVLLCVIGHA